MSIKWFCTPAKRAARGLFCREHKSYSIKKQRNSPVYHGGYPTKKLTLLLAALILTASLLTGCGRPINYDLPENPLEFANDSIYYSPSDPDYSFTVFSYNGRQYISYGSLKGRITGDDVGECLGYYVQDGEKMTDVRFYRLTADPDTNFLIQLDTVGFMSSPDFCRALDTRGLDIEVPKFIQINDMALESGIWD